MKTEPDSDGKRGAWPGRLVGYGLLAWLLGTGAFFYIRFTFAFVHANLDAIQGFLGR